MKKTILATAIAAGLFGVAGSANAAIVTFNTVGNTGSETSEPSTTNDAGVTASSITLGAGITSAANGNRFGGAGFFDTGNTAAGNTLAEAIAGNNFLEFIVTPTGGATVTATSFAFIFDRSGTGPSSVTLRSSADSFATDLGSVTGLVSGGVATTTTNTIDFTDFSFTTPTTFRLYGTGSTSTSGTGGFDTATAATDPNVVLNGSSTVSPEPTSLGLLGLAGLSLFARRRKA